MANPRHAFFGISKFTYPGRNGTFLDLVGLRKRPERAVLLGSGPIEPFEISALPCFGDTTITAVDSDVDVYQMVCRALETGRLDVRSLANVCRSRDSDNYYFLHDDRMVRQLAQVKQQGWDARWDNGRDIATLTINYLNARRLKMILCDLQKELPNELETADLIFEGFMLINWAKTSVSAGLCELFLSALFKKMPRRAWFASATSVTHYLGKYAGSRPFLRQAWSAGLLPSTGVMMRWSVGENEQVTSQFGSVFRVTETLDESLFQLGNSFEQDTLHWISTFGVQHESKIVDINRLAALIEAGDVLSFRPLDERWFNVLAGSWQALSRQCLFKDCPYELRVDYEAGIGSSDNE